MEILYCSGLPQDLLPPLKINVKRCLHPKSNIFLCKVDVTRVEVNRGRLGDVIH